MLVKSMFAQKARADWFLLGCRWVGVPIRKRRDKETGTHKGVHNEYICKNKACVSR